MTRLVALALVASAALIIAMAVRPAAGQQAQDCAIQPYAEAQVPGAPRLQLELALTSEQQQRGLMHRHSLPADSGMLFVFGEPRRSGFWMLNTLIPLSVAYIGQDGTVQDIVDMAVLAPGDPLVSYPPSKPYWYALEANQGWFAQNGVTVGTVLTLCFAV
jgi:uncharacterized membrane protein (UPF0127 family)